VSNFIKSIFLHSLRQLIIIFSVKSPIDGKPMDGIPSIRVHSITNCVGTSRFIRWTELFIIKVKSCNIVNA
jgi:hypothetical protein